MGLLDRNSCLSLLPGRVQELFILVHGEQAQICTNIILLSLLSGYLARNGSNRGGKLGGLFGNIEYVMFS